MYFPNTPNGKLGQRLHRAVYRGLGQSVVMRLKNAPPNIEIEDNASMVIFKVRHQRLLLTMPETGIVSYMLQRESAPTADYPCLTWVTEKEGIVTDDLLDEVVCVVTNAFLQPITFTPINAYPYHSGAMTDLRWFKVASMGANVKGYRVTDEAGVTLNISYQEVVKGAPMVGMTGYLDTMGTWWWWPHPTRSSSLIKKLEGATA